MRHPCSLSWSRLSLVLKKYEQYTAYQAFSFTSTPQVVNPKIKLAFWRERARHGRDSMTHTFLVISLCSQWLWLFLQAALELKNSSNTGAIAAAATSWV